MKKCPKCNIIKDFNKFYKFSRSKDRLAYWCIDCDKMYKKSLNGKTSHNKTQRKYEKTLEGKKTNAKYKRNRYNIDPLFKLVENVKRRILLAIKTNKKSTNTMNLIGCTKEQLRSHLEFRFTNGMSWENQGEWHIDHIKPCSSFDLSKPEEQRKCFHYTNLQPLWAEDNLRKSNRICEEQL